MDRPSEFHLPIVTSTSDYAKELLSSYPYVLVTAQYQTAGRGRKGRTWIGDFGANVYLSIGIRHTMELTTEDLCSFMARGALALLPLLRRYAPGIAFRIKYPNDVQAYTNNQWSKIAGILVEHEFHGSTCVSTVVGIGLNVDQTKFPDTIGQPCTSLRNLGSSIAARDIFSDIREEYIALAQQPWKAVYEKWVSELNVDGRQVNISGSDDEWRVTRITTDGRMIVQNLVTQIERTVTDGDTVRYKD